MPSRTFVVGDVAGVLLACASANTRGRSSSAEGSSNTFVTSAELSRYGQLSLAEALEALRPTLLRGRGVAPGVSVDGSPIADLTILRSIPTSHVTEVRLVRASSSVGAVTVL